MRDWRRLLSGLAYVGVSKLLLELAVSTVATLIVTWSLSNLVLAPQAPTPRPASAPARNELPFAEIPATVVFSPPLVGETAAAAVPMPPARTAHLGATPAHEKPAAPVRPAHAHHLATPPAAPAAVTESLSAAPLRLAGAGADGPDVVGPPPADPAPSNERPASQLPFLDRLPNPASLLRPIGVISDRLGLLLPKF
jgi:hypothetical protein